jgi:hypothetical protein
MIHTTYHQLKDTILVVIKRGENTSKGETTTSSILHGKKNTILTVYLLKKNIW